MSGVIPSCSGLWAFVVSHWKAEGLTGIHCRPVWLGLGLVSIFPSASVLRLQLTDFALQVHILPDLVHDASPMI